MDFAWSVAHTFVLDPGAPTSFADNTVGGSDEVSGYTSNLEKGSPLCAFNATGRQITEKTILGLWSVHRWNGLLSLQALDIVEMDGWLSAEWFSQSQASMVITQCPTSV